MSEKTTKQAKLEVTVIVEKPWGKGRSSGFKVDEEHGSTSTEMGKKRKTTMHKATSQTSSCWSRGWWEAGKTRTPQGEPGIEGSLAHMEWG